MAICLLGLTVILWHTYYQRFSSVYVFGKITRSKPSVGNSTFLSRKHHRKLSKLKIIKKMSYRQGNDENEEL